MVKKGVPSLTASETMRPRRRVITAYTRPSTSVVDWISQLYSARRSRGDQSRNPVWMAERVVRRTSPVRRARESRFAGAVAEDGMEVVPVVEGGGGSAWVVVTSSPSGMVEAAVEEGEAAVEEGEATHMSSRKAAMPCTGSLQRGPCAVASWKAWETRSVKSEGWREELDWLAAEDPDSVALASCKL